MHIKTWILGNQHNRSPWNLNTATFGYVTSPFAFAIYLPKLFWFMHGKFNNTNNFFLFPAYLDHTEPIPFWQRMQHQFTGEPQTGERACCAWARKFPRTYPIFPRTRRTFRSASRRYRDSKGSMRSCERGRDAPRPAYGWWGERSGRGACLYARRCWGMQACKHGAPLFLFLGLFLVPLCLLVLGCHLDKYLQYSFIIIAFLCFSIVLQDNWRFIYPNDSPLTADIVMCFVCCVVLNHAFHVQVSMPMFYVSVSRVSSDSTPRFRPRCRRERSESTPLAI